MIWLHASTHAGTGHCHLVAVPTAMFVSWDIIT